MTREQEETAATPPTTTLYFAFGSNLWQEQMARRCPASRLAGVGRLRGFRWFVNARGYANVAPTGDADEVWGLVYDLAAVDEARLDASEGVPHAYQKRRIPVEFWAKAATNKGGQGTSNVGVEDMNGAGSRAAIGKEKEEAEEEPGEDDVVVDGRRGGTMVEMLVYIDLKRDEGGHEPRAEYVHRMNMGIRDALREGVPQAYVDRVLRRYIPPEEDADEGARSLAQRQAARFEEESTIIAQSGKGEGRK
ncbi:hypothetical protein VTK56DRAFT_2811 [Thermocarpiscus australiensis]